jgi:replicative DNA helicase
MTADPPLLGLSQRQPPSNPEAEAALLGGLLANNRAHDHCGLLQPEHFADPVNSRVFEACRTLIQAGKKADAVTLRQVFEHSGVLDEVGGAAYLAQLLASMVGIDTVGPYAEVIRDCWVRRQVILVGEETVNSAFGGSDLDGEAVITEAVSRLMDLSPAHEGAQDWAGAVKAAVDASDAAYRDGATQGLMSGITPLDDMWRGMWAGALDIIGARSGHGKTAAGCQIAEHNARQFLKAGSGETVLIFSLEMTRQDLATRMLASATGIPSDDIRAGKLGDARANAMRLAQADLRALPLKVEDRTGMSLAELAIAARVAKRRRKCRLIVIDHLHKIRPDKAQMRLPRTEQVQAITWGLKELAKSLEIPILLLAQLSRQTERREGPDSARPKVSDLRYAGEDDADNILLLWRPELYLPANAALPSARLTPEKYEETRASLEAAHAKKQADLAGRAEVIFAKRRYGEQGAVMLHFDGPRTRFGMVGDKTTTNLFGGEAPPSWVTDPG